MRTGPVRFALPLVLGVCLIGAATAAPPDDATRHHPRPKAEATGKHRGKPETKAHAPAAAATAPVVPKVPKVPPPPRDASEPPPKLPRFAALKTDETNMRVGPGQRYPITWVYKRRDLPVQVEKEYDVWRFVRDSEGVTGWVHQVTLSDRRTFVVKDKEAIVRASADDKADKVAVLKAGVIGRIMACEEHANWCQIRIQTYRGFLRRDQFWGLLPDEVVTPS